jgi:hypothetical protein
MLASGILAAIIFFAASLNVPQNCSGGGWRRRVKGVRFGGREGVGERKGGGVGGERERGKEDERSGEREGERERWIEREGGREG